MLVTTVFCSVLLLCDILSCSSLVLLGVNDNESVFEHTEYLSTSQNI